MGVTISVYCSAASFENLPVYSDDDSGNSTYYYQPFLLELFREYLSLHFFTQYFLILSPT